MADCVAVDGLALDRVMRSYRVEALKARAALAGSPRRYVEIRDAARRGEG